MVEAFGRASSSDSLINLLLADLIGKVEATRAFVLDAAGTVLAMSPPEGKNSKPLIEKGLLDTANESGSGLSTNFGLCVRLRRLDPTRFVYLERDPAVPFTLWEQRYAALLCDAAVEVYFKSQSEEQARGEAERRREMEETLREILDDTSSVSGAEFFPTLVRRLAAALHMKFGFATEVIPPGQRARALAFWLGDTFYGDLEYDLEATPCEGVIRGEIGYYPRNLGGLFPKDIGLINLGVESYLGVPMLSSSGEIIGHIAVMDNKPLDDSWLTLPILKTFAARGGVELERHRDHQRLREALEEVSRLERRLQAENLYLREEIGGEHNFKEIIGDSPKLTALLRKVEQVAPTDSSVLILGETGTGKELIARAIHDRSSRRERPLVKVNCGAISAGLVESELFGHVRGAFTGALDKRVGRFELANGGTIFLDEVGELPFETQVKLLRVLQEQEFEPVGSSQTKKVNVRVIAATNRDLQKAVDEGRFRADLYYRLNVFPLEAPPLRQRQEDIPQLAAYFVGQVSRRFGVRVDSIDDESVARLCEYCWPGNVRELQNVIERAVVLADGPTLHLPAELFPSAVEPRPQLTMSPAIVVHGGIASMSDAERGHITAALEKANWVIEGPRGAALALRLHPNTLRSRMRKLGVTRPSPSPH